jgi:hypothetical protein
VSPQAIIWIVAAVATAGVIIRPFNWPEAIWAVTGAALLVLSGLLSPSNALISVANGTDVYLFLVGMMLLAEIARPAGRFDWLAVIATIWARGSAGRLFLLIYGVGTIATAFLSNKQPGDEGQHAQEMSLMIGARHYRDGHRPPGIVSSRHPARPAHGRGRDTDRRLRAGAERMAPWMFSSGRWTRLGRSARSALPFAPMRTGQTR